MHPFCNPTIVVICCAIAAFDGLLYFEIFQDFIYVNLDKMTILFQGTTIKAILQIIESTRLNQQYTYLALPNDYYRNTHTG